MQPLATNRNEEHKLAQRSFSLFDRRTFSALMLEALLFARAQRNDLLLVYLGGTLVAGLLLVWAGARLAEALRAASP